MSSPYSPAPPSPAPAPELPSRKLPWQTKLFGLLLGLTAWTFIYAAAVVLQRVDTETARVFALGAVSIGFLLMALPFLLGMIGLIFRKRGLAWLPLFALLGFLVPFGLTRIPTLNLILSHGFAAWLL